MYRYYCKVPNLSCRPTAAYNIALRFCYLIMLYVKCQLHTSNFESNILKVRVSQWHTLCILQLKSLTKGIGIFIESPLCLGVPYRRKFTGKGWTLPSQRSTGVYEECSKLQNYSSRIDNIKCVYCTNTSCKGQYFHFHVFRWQNVSCRWLVTWMVVCSTL